MQGVDFIPHPTVIAIGDVGDHRAPRCFVGHELFTQLRRGLSGGTASSPALPNGQNSAAIENTHQRTRFAGVNFTIDRFQPTKTCGAVLSIDRPGRRRHAPRSDWSPYVARDPGSAGGG